MAPAEKFSASLPTTSAAKFAAASLTPGVQHLDRVAADRVHLRVELDAEHAVAEIDQARAGVLARRTWRRRWHGGAAPGSGAASRCAVGRALQLRTASQRLERTELPAEAPPHRAIDVVDRVGDLRRDRCGVVERRHERVAQERADLVLRRRTASGCARRRSRSLRAASSDGSRAGCFGRYSSVAGSSVRISLAGLLVEALAGLLADPAARDQLARRAAAARTARGRRLVGSRSAQVARDVREDVERRRCPSSGTSRSSAGRAPAR